MIESNDLKIILTYQANHIDNAVVAKMHELNKKYREDASLEMALKPDDEIAIYRELLPKNQPHFVFVENKRVMGLDSEIENLEDFIIKTEGGDLPFNCEQANFRIVQDFAWATQLLTKSDRQVFGLVYAFVVSTADHARMCAENYESYNARQEFEKLIEKNGGSLSKEYLKKTVHICPRLPKEAKLIGIYNASSGPLNKAIIFDGENLGTFAIHRQLINAAKYALIGYKPGSNTLNVSSYDSFKIPVVNLKKNVLCVCNPHNTAVFEDAMLVTSSSGASKGKVPGFSASIMQQFGKPTPEAYKQALDEVRYPSMMPVVSIEERQNVFEDYGKMKQQLQSMQKKLAEKDAMQGELERIKRRQDILMNDYFKSRLVIFEKDHIVKYPELQAFYRRIQQKMTEFFLACKVINSGTIDRAQDKANQGLNIAGNVNGFVCNIAGKALGFIPGVGFAVGVVDGIVKAGLKAGELVHNQQEATLIANISKITASLTEMDEMVEETARKLTLTYEKQIRCLTYSKELAGLKAVLAKAKLICNMKNGGAEDMAEAVVGKMIDAMRSGVIKFSRGESIAEQFFQAIVHRPDKKLTLFGKSTLETISPKLKKWNTNGVFQKSGIFCDKEHYAGKTEKDLFSRPSKYGYHRGEASEVKKFGLFKQTPVANEVDNLVKEVYRQPEQKDLVQV